MTQKERDRLVALKKAKKKLITQKEAAGEIGVSERQVRRMLRALKQRGDRAVVHAGRDRPSNRKIADEVECQATDILSQDVYHGFGPTLFQCAVHIASGRQLDGVTAVDPGTVLYGAFGEPRTRTVSRLRKLAPEGDWTENLHFV